MLDATLPAALEDSPHSLTCLLASIYHPTTLGLRILQRFVKFFDEWVRIPQAARHQLSLPFANPLYLETVWVMAWRMALTFVSG